MKNKLQIYQNLNRGVIKVRGYLNQPGEWDSGHVEVTLEKSRRYVDLELTLADCSRKIHLNFNVGSDTDVRRRLEKVAKLKYCLDFIESELKKLTFDEPDEPDDQE